MRLSLVFVFLLLVTGPAFAQRGATGPVADLNNQAKALSDTDPDRSLVVAQQALAAARAADDVRGQAEALNYIAYGYRAQSLLDIARQNALESTRLYVQAKDRWGEAQGYNMLGLIEADAGQFATALEYHLKALAIRQQDGDREGLAYTFNNLGNMQRNMGDYAKALEYHEQGLALKQELGLTSSESISHHNMGLVYFAMGDHARALAAYQRGLAIREKLQDTRAIAVSLNSIGLVQAQTSPQAALRTYERVLAMRRQTGDTRGEMATHLNIADVYRQLRQWPLATAAYDRALALGDKLDAPLMRSNALKGLAEVEAARGDFASAYKHQLGYQQQRDMMFNQENAIRFQRLQVAHEAESRQRQIELLEREGALREAELARVRVTRTALATIVGLVLVSLGLMYARYRSKQQSESRLRAQAATLAEALERVKTLRGLLPICAWCKKIRDDKGYWLQVESYLSSHTAAEFTHCICPSCAHHLSPDATPESPR